MTLYRNFTDALTGERTSVLETEGMIVERGDLPEVPNAEVVDLAGKWVLPSFVDAHCHILPMGLDLQKLHLGNCSNHRDVLDALSARHREQPDGWLLAVHYDQTKYEGIHLVRDQLDAISADRPILLRHVSGHASVANSAALRAAKVDESTTNPEGGTFERDQEGRLNGVLLEHAHERVSAAVPNPTLDEMVDAILRAGERMRSWNIAGACDMMTGRFDLELELQAYEIAAQKGCPVETRLYVQWKTVFGPRGIGADELRARSSRVGGIKIFADGAIGSATAAIYGRYTGATAQGPYLSRRSRPAPAPEGVEVSGQLIYAPERLQEMVRKAHDAGFQVATHSIGDYSTDLVMDAYEATGEPQRHRIEHSMLLSDAQIERLARLGSAVTFQPEFLLRFGHSYLRQLGPERTARLKRTRSLLDAGIPLAFSSDQPIVNGNPVDGIATAVHRPEAFDPAENCTMREALALYTREAARLGSLGGVLGTLVPGKLARLQVFDADPTRKDCLF
ncbi:MAG TPA: amidohydrolase [Fimbriimonas sp.]